MPERADYETARVLLLSMIRDWLDREEKPHPNPDALEIRGDDFRHFGEEQLGWNAVETSRLFKRLVREGFVRTFRDEIDFLEIDGVISYAWVEDLTDEGDKLLGVLSNPTEQLVESLNEVLETIQGLDSGEVSGEQKALAEKALGELKQFSRGLAPGAALQVIKAFLSAHGIHLP